MPPHEVHWMTLSTKRDKFLGLPSPDPVTQYIMWPSSQWHPQPLLCDLAAWEVLEQAAPVSAPPP